VRSGRPVALEALLRWRHPDRGTVSAADFLPVAEQTGLILPVGAWVLQTACAALARWHACHPEHGGLGMSVNLFGRQLTQGDLAAVVRSALDDTGVDPAALSLEITEKALMDDRAGVLATLNAVRRLGPRLALDDFGTGSSSLSNLHRFPIDALKIDRSFITDLDHNSKRLAITNAIISMGQTLGIATVAEGVESHAELTSLRGLSCDQAQGYHFARPLSPAQVTAYLTDL